MEESRKPHTSISSIPSISSHMLIYRTTPSLWYNKHDMADFYTQIQGAGDLSEAQQKKTGQAIAGDMDEKYKRFCVDIERMIKSNEIDVGKPESFLNMDVYNELSDEWKGKTDLALMNIADQVRHIAEFYTSKDTPNSSPQLQTMIEQLWQMKERIEKHHDVFKF